jgi:hypothetical protein
MKQPKKVCLIDTNIILRFNRSELLQALLKFETSNVDIVDCVLAAMSSSSRVVVFFDKDMLELKAVTETL